MEKMIVTRALDERDLLIKKINDAIDRASFVTVKKTSDDIVIGGKKSVQEFDDEARADLQSIRDLISRYNRLDAAILLANATTDIEVAGVTMTRARQSISERLYLEEVSQILTLMTLLSER